MTVARVADQGGNARSTPVAGSAQGPALYPGTLRPLWAIAMVLGRSEDTVRDWYRHGDLEPAACHRATRALLFDLGRASELHAASATYNDAPTRERCA